MNLADRIEAATADQQRELLVEAARLIWGWDFCPPAEDPDEWVCRWNRFHRKIEAEAPLDAAMLLLPKGWDWFKPDNDDGKLVIRLERYRKNWRFGTGATEALALAAAAIRAKGTDDE